MNEHMKYSLPNGRIAGEDKIILNDVSSLIISVECISKNKCLMKNLFSNFNFCN